MAYELGKEHGMNAFDLSNNDLFHIPGNQAGMDIHGQSVLEWAPLPCRPRVPKAALNKLSQWLLF